MTTVRAKAASHPPAPSGARRRAPPGRRRPATAASRPSSGRLKSSFTPRWRRCEHERRRPTRRGRTTTQAGLMKTASPTTRGISLSENEWASRRKCRWTTKTSVAAKRAERTAATTAPVERVSGTADHDERGTGRASMPAITTISARHRGSPRSRRGRGSGRSARRGHGEVAYGHGVGVESSRSKASAAFEVAPCGIGRGDAIPRSRAVAAHRAPSPGIAAATCCPTRSRRSTSIPLHDRARPAAAAPGRCRSSCGRSRSGPSTSRRADPAARHVSPVQR